MIVSLLTALVLAAAEEPKLSCPHHEEFPVSFSSWESEDLFSIDLLGSDCGKSVRVVTVRNSLGYPIYTNSVRLQQLAAQPLSYRDTLIEAVETVRESVSGQRSGNLPEFGSPDVDPENFYQGGEENRVNYEKARAADRPVMCVRLGWESWECFWFDPEKRSVEFLYWFGA